MTEVHRAQRASYVHLARFGELEVRARALDAMLGACTVCPHECRVDRRTEVGDAWDLGPDGALKRGILIRMLVLPDNLAGIETNLEWIATKLSPKIAISLLAQYRPAHRVIRTLELSELNRRITTEEWRQAASSVERFMEGDRHRLQWG